MEVHPYRIQPIRGVNCGLIPSPVSMPEIPSLESVFDALQGVAFHLCGDPLTDFLATWLMLLEKSAQ